MKIDKDWLYDQYITQHLSVDTIIKTLNCGKTTVFRYLKLYNIPARTLLDARTCKNDKLTLLRDKDWLIEHYINQHKTPTQIGEELGCGRTTVMRYIEKFNITPRNVSEAKLGDSLPLLQNYDWLFDQYVTNKKTMEVIMNELGCSSTVLVKYLDLYNIPRRTDYCVSTMEFELQDFLTKHNIIFSSSNRKVIYPYELDIYIPECKLGIELNGIYWHSLTSLTDTPENKKRHLNKTNLCLDNDITLFQFTSSEWNNKQDVIKSMILNKVGLSRKIFARKCTLEYVAKNIEQDFFNANHIQGYTNSSICIGLKYNDEYVTMISFRKPRYTRGYDLEILRIASKLNTTVVGGVSKLFKNFLKDNEYASFITYADRRYSTGNIYKVLGFEFSHNSDIGYKWAKQEVLYNRWNFMKHKLKDKLKLYDSELSERDNMFNNDYRKLYDCGQSVFVLDIS
jgi:AraC-like DNA-binding protein